jgi:hypothetical protein
MLNLAVSAASTYLQDLACLTAGRVGTSVSIKGLFEAGERDPEIKRLLNWHVPVGELDDIEKAADAAGADLIRRLKALPGEHGRLLRCGAAVNKDQLRQAFVNIGVKPGLLDGELMPEPIDTSFLHGLRNVEDFYICATGSRKALTTNYRQVKTSGYLSRKLVLLVADHVIDPDLDDCHTANYIHTLVQSPDHAKRLSGRYIKCNENDTEHLAYEEELVSLIGTKVLLRSPITCAGEKGICHKCYGELARSNSDLHAGIYGVLVLCEQITQRLLSSKHLLKARPTKIAWPDEFLEHFSVERASIIAESSIDKIYIHSDDIEMDEDEGRQSTSVFYYKATGKLTRTKITTPVPIYLDADAWENAEVDEGEATIIPVQETAIFQVPVSNTDLSEALHAIFTLIERDEIDTYNNGYMRLMELLTHSNLQTPSIHAEIILRALVRDNDNYMERPDFRAENPPYAMLKLSPAILNSPSISNSLAFERVKAQLTSTEILKKNKAGPIDALFGA